MFGLAHATLREIRGVCSVRGAARAGLGMCAFRLGHNAFCQFHPACKGSGGWRGGLGAGHDGMGLGTMGR
eukprot:13852932-Alexandrium_andersonii.AAC.1